MEGMEEKLNSILGNPQLMQQIMTMANSISSQPPPQPEVQPQNPQLPEFDPATLQKIISLSGQLGVDPNQKALLRALQPYLTGNRLEKLEKAMRAARLAGTASQFLQDGSIPFFSGR